MAVNVTLTGRTFDEGGVTLAGQTVYYKGLHYSSSSKVSQVRVTESDSFFNFNLGDPDWLGQDSNLLVGDWVVIAFWMGNSDPLQNQNRFCLYRFQHDGRDVYEIDVQLRPSVSPSCAFTLPSSVLINTPVSPSNSSSDLYQWIFNSKTFYHRRDWYSHVFFNVGIQQIEYDWGQGFTPSSIHAFDSVGTKVVSSRVTNFVGQTSTCQATTSVRYPQPNVSLSSSSPSTFLNGSVDFITHVDNPYSTIDRIDALWDGLPTGWNQSNTFSLTENRQYTYSILVHWNDGIQDQSFMRSISVSVENQPPATDFTLEKQSNWVATPIASDIDGYVDSIIWSVYFELPISGVKTEIYSSGHSSVSQFEIDLIHPGKYTLRLTAYDDKGASSFHEEDIEVEGTGAVRIDGYCKLIEVISDRIDVNIDSKPTEIFVDFTKEIIEFNQKKGGFDIIVTKNEAEITSKKTGICT